MYERSRTIFNCLNSSKGESHLKTLPLNCIQELCHVILTLAVHKRGLEVLIEIG